MPDSIGSNGLQVLTAAQIIDGLINGFTDPFTGQTVPGLNAIYGADLNSDSNTSDGQCVGLLAQQGIDVRELLVGINNSFDPDQAQGVLLAQRCAINNIKPNGGSYTIQPISIVTSTTVTLQGLDAAIADPNGTGYTIQDTAGNQFILENTTTFTAGTAVANFRAQQVGAVSVPVDTITVPITIISGVISVNNPNPALTEGVNQETDGALRIRRADSTQIATSGNSNGLKAKLLALSSVTEAEVYQNRTNTTDGNGIPAHCMWLIVAGGSNADIANLIYQTISDGCNMKGGVTYNLTTPSGAIFSASWDVPVSEPLYITFTIKRTVPGFNFSISAIQAYIAANLVYNIGKFAETSSITAVAAAAIAAQGGGGVAVLMTISSDDITFTDYLDAATLASQFTVATANIDITVV